MSTWIVAGLRTPFVKSGGPFASMDAVALSVHVVRAMIAQLQAGAVDFVAWGTVIPDLAWSNIAREVVLDSGLAPTVPAFSTTMACSTSMMGAIEAAGMLDDRARSLALVGGAESLSHLPRGFAIANRTTGKSMGEHMEMTIDALGGPSRAAQDALALGSHRNAVAAQDRGFFDDLIVAVDGVAHDTFPRRDTSAEKLATLQPVFGVDGRGSITAGNASPLTDGAAAVWVATDAGLTRLPGSLPRARIVDWEIAAVDIHRDGLLMAPAHAIPRLLRRHGLRYDDIALWEIHEAFAAQVLAHITLLEMHHAELGSFPRERVNPNGGTVALGHPFGATGARILSQAAKELSSLPLGSKAIISVCADGGEGSVMLLET